MALSTIGTAAIADDAITSAKVDSTTAAFTVADLVVTNGITAGAGITAATSINAGTELVGNVSGRILLDASAAATDVGDEFLLNATDASASNDGSKILFEEATDDPNTVLNSNNTGVGGTLTFASATTFDTAPTGAGGLQLLFSQASSTAVASIDIDEAYINSTYDSYYVVGNVKVATDGGQFRLKLKSGGSIVTGSKHGYDNNNGGNSDLADTADFIRFNYSTLGNAVGEGVQFNFYMHNVNSTIYPTFITGCYKTAHTAGQHEGGYVAGGFIASSYALVCNGFNLVAASGNLDTHSIKVYGVV